MYFGLIIAKLPLFFTFITTKKSSICLAAIDNNTMIILLSPSKTVDFSRSLVVSPPSDIVFPQESVQLNGLLRTFSVDDLQQLMTISKDLALLNFHRNKKWNYPFSPSQTQNAIFAFHGEAYNGFDADSLTPEELDIAQKQLVILSGLYGVLRPLDAILPYRLEMGTKLINPLGDNLYHFWRAQITQHINMLLQSDMHKTLINLASDEYFKCLDSKQLTSQIITPQFLDFSGGHYKVVSVYTKKARGAMARYLCSPFITSPNDLLAFQGLGYHYDANRSSYLNPVFIR